MRRDLDSDFANFVEEYEQFFRTSHGQNGAVQPHVVFMDKEAEGLLDDLKFLLTTTPEHQKETRQKLRRSMAKIAQERLKKDSK